MAIDRFLAMTAAEFPAETALPGKAAWMACHFSPYGRGLSNLPRELPKGSLLLLDDLTPPQGHDPRQTAQQLAAAASDWDCRGILLDFQRPPTEETAAMARYLSQSLPCPVAVSSLYAGPLDCAVCLPPVPCHVPLGEHLAPWQGREIWLELALDGEAITLTAKGAQIRPLAFLPEREGFFDRALDCRYCVEMEENQALFTLWRTRDSLSGVQAAAEKSGVTLTVGLWQELGG